MLCFMLCLFVQQSEQKPVQIDEQRCDMHSFWLIKDKSYSRILD